MKRFKIRPFRKGKEYFNCIVFDRKSDMRRDRDAMGIKIEKYDAMTTTYIAHKKKKGKIVKLDMVGDIVFYRKDLGVGAVSHEMTHAANHVHTLKLEKNNHNLNVRKKNKVWKAWDESLAWSVGYMTNQFWKKYKGKIYRKEIY